MKLIAVPRHRQRAGGSPADIFMRLHATEDSPSSSEELTLPRELKREKELSKGGFWGKSPLCLLSSKIPPFVMMFPSAQDLRARVSGG